MTISTVGYWVSTGLAALIVGASGIGDLAGAPQVAAEMSHLPGFHRPAGFPQQHRRIHRAGDHLQHMAARGREVTRHVAALLLVQESSHFTASSPGAVVAVDPWSTWVVGF